MPSGIQSNGRSSRSSNVSRRGAPITPWRRSQLATYTLPDMTCLETPPARRNVKRSDRRLSRPSTSGGAEILESRRSRRCGMSKAPRPRHRRSIVRCREASSPPARSRLTIQGHRLMSWPLAARNTSTAVPPSAGTLSIVKPGCLTNSTRVPSALQFAAVTKPSASTAYWCTSHRIHT